MPFDMVLSARLRIRVPDTRATLVVDINSRHRCELNGFVISMLGLLNSLMVETLIHQQVLKLFPFNHLITKTS